MIPVIEGHAAPPSHQAHGTHHGLAARDACGKSKAGQNEQTPTLGPDAHEMLPTRKAVSQPTLSLPPAGPGFWLYWGKPFKSL